MPDDNTATPAAPAPPTPAAAAPSTAPAAPATPEAPPPTGELGEAGKAALEAERVARRNAERLARESTAELEKLRTAAMTDQEKAVAEARREGKAEGTRLILEAEIRAAAAGKLANPALAARLLNVDELMPKDGGEVDAERIGKAIEELIAKEPYLAVQAATGTPPAPGTPPTTPPPPAAGTVAGGARGQGNPGTFKRSELRDPAFYAAHKDEILKAAQEGRITND